MGEQELGPLESYFAKALLKSGKIVNYINIHSIYPERWRKLSKYSHRLPRKYDNKIRWKYFRIVNDSLIEKYNSGKPSHIFIYNDCLVLPETINYFKANGTKVIILLGDDANYLFPAKKTFLLTVINADYVILPDTGWIEGLKMLGIDKIIYSPIGTDPEIFFKTDPSQEQRKKFECDLLFIGTGYYLNAWGIRRASILNELSGLYFKIFGDRYWKELFPFFPDLKKHFTLHSLYYEEVNIACNCSKIYPVVVNSGVINGASTRVFDCLASEIFILAEYRKDIDMLFPGGEIEYFKNKKELKDKANYFLKNDRERIERIQVLKKIILEKYTIDISVKNILEQLEV